MNWKDQGPSTQRGAVAPLIAVLLLVIVVCVAFVVDLGHIHNVKIELQRAVDAAALAAAKQLPNATNVDTVARAVAATNTVDNAPVPVDAASLQVEMGLWRTDTTSMGLPVSDGTDNCTTPTDRWNSQVREDMCGSAANAVLVRATRDVEHAFFFFVNDTEVIADAIALAEPINPILPLSVVSCIPLDRIQSDPGKIPGTDVCDIRYFSFSPDVDDSAAWTGLTFGNDVGDISDFLQNAQDLKLFQKVVFGEGVIPATNGIENEPPKAKTSPPCEPDELDIKCGLGMIKGKTLAAANEFSGPSAAGAAGVNIPQQDGHWIPYSAGFDPMYDYAANGALPRWYNINSNSSLQTDDHFTRLWTMDGTLLAGPGENLATYQLRLKNWRDNSTTAPPQPLNDGRMAELLMELQPNNELSKALLNKFGYTTTSLRNQFFADNPSLGSKIYFPDFYKIMERAGYPIVGVTNGSAASLMGYFLDNPEVTSSEITRTLNCKVNDPPLPGKTLRVQIPVVFAGFCEQWKALATPSGNWNLTYVGLADLLVTRAWKNPGDYDCGDTFVSISGASCSATDFEISPAADGTFSAVNNNQLSIEGLFKVPIIDETEAASTVKVLLVE